MAKFTPTNKANPCPVCGDIKGKCRHTETDLILCMSGAGGTYADAEWVYKGDTKDGLWGKYRSVSDRPLPPPPPPKPIGFMGDMSLSERDKRWRAYLAKLELDETDRADLVRRGLSPEQINRGWYRSVSDGYLIPIFYGRFIVGAQKRLRDGTAGRYRWHFCPNVPKKINGQLPIGVALGQGAIHPKIKALIGEVKPLVVGESFLRGNIVTETFGIPYLGYGGVSQLQCSKGLIKEALDTFARDIVLKAVDAGCLVNPQVMNYYRSILADLQAWGIPTLILWWGQGHSKACNDLDELTEEDLEKLTLLTPDEFLAMAGDTEEKVTYYNPDDREEVILDAIKTHKHILITDRPGSGKTHSIPGIAKQVGKLTYISNDHRNPTIEALNNFADIEGKHKGLKLEGDKLRRATAGEPIETPANCSRVDAHLMAVSKGLDNQAICLTCPLHRACQHGSGDGYGFLNDRKDALIRDHQRCHPQSLPSPTDYAYNDRVLAWDEIGTIEFTESIAADRDDVANLIVALGDRIPALTAYLKELWALFPDRSEHWGRNADKLPPVPTLTPEELQTLESLLTPDYDVLQEPDTIAPEEFDRVRGYDKHRLAQVSKALKCQTRQTSDEVEGLIKQMPNQWILWLLNGGVPYLHNGSLTITRANDRFREVAQAAKANIYLDATMTADRLALMLGVDKSEILTLKAKTPPTPNLKIYQVIDMGKMTRYRGADQEYRLDALINHARSIDPTTKVIDFKKFDRDGAWFRDNRGSNDFLECKTLILSGTPYPNIEAVRSDYLALGGNSDNFQRYYDRLVQAEFIQAFERLRALRRLDTTLTVIAITDIPLPFPGIQTVTAGELCPDAKPKHERTIDRVIQAGKQLIDNGLRVTQTAIAKMVGLARETVNRLWESVTFCLENYIRKKSHSPPPLDSPDDVPLVAEIVKTVLNENNATLNDIAEVFSYLDRSWWDKLLYYLTPDDVEKLAALAIT